MQSPYSLLSIYVVIEYISATHHTFAQGCGDSSSRAAGKSPEHVADPNKTAPLQ